MIVNKTDLVWTTFTHWETEFWKGDTDFIRHNYVMYLPLLPFIGLAIARLSKEKNKIVFFILVWFLLPIGLLCINDSLAIAKARLLHLFIHVPAAILMSYGIMSVKRRSLRFVTGIVVCLFFFYCLIQVPKQIQNQVKTTQSEILSLLYYPPHFFLDLIHKIDQTTPANAVLIVPYSFGNIAAALNPRIYYIGEQTQGLNWSLNTLDYDTFFTQQLTSEAGLQFLHSKQITYVLDGQEAPGWSLNRVLTYPFLSKQWEYENFVLYKVEK
jgi:hypothetical protein